MAANEVLSEGDRQSAAWLKIKAHLERRLHGLRIRNDNFATLEKKLQLVGQIGEVKHLLTLGDPKPSAPLEETGFKD